MSDRVDVVIVGGGAAGLSGALALARARRSVLVEVSLAGGATVGARRLLVAAGAGDELPDVPGLAQLWGTDVLHCPYCHGWEVRDQPVGVLSTSAMGVHAALLWRQWPPDVTLFLHTGPQPAPDESDQLAARGIAVVAGQINADLVAEETRAAVAGRAAAGAV